MANVITGLRILTSLALLFCPVFSPIFYAECDPRNVPSWQLLEKVGLKREVHFKQNIWFHKDESGKPIWKDTYVYAVTEGDWGDIKNGIFGN